MKSLKELLLLPRTYSGYDECLYVIPNGHKVYMRDIIDISIKSDVINQFDILPSIIPTFPRSIIMSEKLKNSGALQGMNFEYIPLEAAARTLFGRKYEDFDNIGINMLETLTRYTEQELNNL